MNGAGVDTLLPVCRCGHSYAMHARAQLAACTSSGCACVHYNPRQHDGRPAATADPMALTLARNFAAALDEDDRRRRVSGAA